MSMRIAIDASWAQGRATGIGMYVRELCQALAAVAPENEYFLLHWSAIWNGPDFGPAFRPVSYRCGGSALASVALRLDRVLRKLNVDVYHATASTGVPPRTAVPVVATVHDLYRFHPDDHTPWIEQRKFRWMFRWTLRHARHYLVNSQFTADELHRCFGIARDRITPTLLAPASSGATQRPAECDRTLLLCLGGIEPRKGQLFLVDVYEALLRRMPEAPPLVFAGPDRGDGARLRQALARPFLRGRVQWRDYVDDTEREQLYAQAMLFLMPSSFEGFGMPLVEAMARSVPAVASDIPPFREIAGDATALLPVNNVDAWAETVARLLGDAGQCARLADAGCRHATTFSWQACARRTLACYEQVARNRQGMA